MDGLDADLLNLQMAVKIMGECGVSEMDKKNEDLVQEILNVKLQAMLKGAKPEA